MSETVFCKDDTVKVFPSDETVLMLYHLIGQNIIAVSENDKIVEIKVSENYNITVDKAMGLPGDCCHIKVNDLPTLHI